MAESDSAALFRLRFPESLDAEICRENFFQLPYEPTSEQSIYRIPSLLRDLDPNAYEPRVVSIGPYHYGKEQLQAMERYKYRALNCFLSRNDGISLTLKGILAEFREPSFLEEVRNCYTEPLKPHWSDDDFLRLMVLDGCFLLELLLDDCPEKHALLSYVKMDMLVLDNQIPLLVLRKLASIANLISNRPSASQPTGSENVVIQVEEQVEEQIKELNITGLIWKFYGTKNDEIPADLEDAHHVLDAYWRKGCIGNGDNDGWVSRESAKELNYLGVRFRQSSGPSDRGVADGFVGMRSLIKDVLQSVLSELLSSSRPAEPSDQSQRHLGVRFRQSSGFVVRGSFKDVAYNPPKMKSPTDLLVQLLLSFLTFLVDGGMLDLPHLTIDETTRPTLLNLMAFELLHLRYKKNYPVTDYVLLMGSLIRSEIDAEHLRHRSILWCSPGWTDESVVKLFADLTRNIAFDGTRRINTEIDALCERPSNMYSSAWRRLSSTDWKSRAVVLLSLYGLSISFLGTVFTIIKFFQERKCN